MHVGLLDGTVLFGSAVTCLLVAFCRATMCKVTRTQPSSTGHQQAAAPAAICTGLDRESHEDFHSAADGLEALGRRARLWKIRGPEFLNAFVASATAGHQMPPAARTTFESPLPETAECKWRPGQRVQAQSTHQSWREHGSLADCQRCARYCACAVLW